MQDRRANNLWYRRLDTAIKQLGGMFNAHLHLDPARWNLMVEGAKHADFLAALPEADDTDEYPSHIGFYEHCKRMLLLAKEHGKMLHVHTDQRNEPSEDGTEELVR